MPSEKSKAELRQLEIEFRKKAALNKAHGRQEGINLHLANIISSHLKG